MRHARLSPDRVGRIVSDMAWCLAGYAALAGAAWLVFFEVGL